MHIKNAPGSPCSLITAIFQTIVDVMLITATDNCCRVNSKIGADIVVQ